MTRRIITSAPVMLVALFWALPSAAAPDDTDLFGEFEQALDTSSGRAFLDTLGGLRPVDQADPANDARSFDNKPVAAGGFSNDITRSTDGSLTLTDTAVTTLVDLCGHKTANGLDVVCPTFALNAKKLTDVRFFGVDFAQPLAPTSGMHVVVAGNETARPDVPVRPDQPGNFLSGSDQFLRLQRAADGGWSYGYYLFTGTTFGQFHVDTLAVVGPQSAFIVASADALKNWNTFFTFTDSPIASGIPVGDRTAARSFSTARAKLSFVPGANAAPATGTGTSTSGGGFPVLGLVLVIGGVVALAGGGFIVVNGRRSQLGYVETPDVLFDDDAARTAWQTATLREAEIQHRLEANYSRVAEALASELANFRDAGARYAQGFNSVLRDAQFLGGVAQEWNTARKVTGALDLVLAALEGGPALYKLGKSGWAKLGRVLFGAAEEAAATGTQAAQALDRARALINGNDQLRTIANDAAGINIAAQFPATTFMRGADEILIDAAVLAEEAGVDFAATAPARVEALTAAGIPLYGAIGAVWADMAEAAAAARGWIRAADDVRTLVSDVLINTRSYCRGGVVDAGALKDALVGFRQLVGSQPEFFETLPKLYAALGDARQSDHVLTLLYHPDDVEFLRWLAHEVDSGVDLAELPALWQAKLGPIGAAGGRITVTSGMSVVETAGEIHSAGELGKSGYEFGTGLFTGLPVITSIFPSYDTYIGQHGILNPTLLGWEAGDSLPLTITFNAVNAVGGPTTWLTGFTGSLEGTLLWSDVAPDVATTCSAMSGAALDLLAAVDRLTDLVTIDGIGIDDRNALRDAQATYDGALATASPALRDELGPQLDERRAHIAQKLAQLDGVVSVLAGARNWLSLVRDALTAQVRSERTSTQWADPGLAASFVSAGVLLDGLAYSVLNPAQSNASTAPRPPQQLTDYEGLGVGEWPAGHDDVTVVVEPTAPPPPDATAGDGD